MHRPDPDQALTFLRSLAGDRMEAFYTVSIALGLRPGEVSGLTWSAVEGSVLHIRHTLQRIDGEYVLAPPKTPRSVRDVPLPAFVEDALRRQRARQREEYLETGARPEHDLAFTTRGGRPLDASSLKRDLDARLRALDLPVVTRHDLRHAAASLLHALGIGPRDVMEVLGHATYVTTMNRYTHVDQTELAAKMSLLDTWRSG